MPSPREELDRLRWEQLARGLQTAGDNAERAAEKAEAAEKAAKDLAEEIRRTPLRVMLAAFAAADWKGRAAILALPCLTLLLAVVLLAGESPTELIRALGTLWHDCPPADTRRPSGHEEKEVFDAAAG